MKLNNCHDESVSERDLQSIFLLLVSSLWIHQSLMLVHEIYYI